MGLAAGAGFRIHLGSPVAYPEPSWCAWCSQKGSGFMDDLRKHRQCWVSWGAAEMRPWSLICVQQLQGLLVKKAPVFITKSTGFFWYKTGLNS